MCDWKVIHCWVVMPLSAFVRQLCCYCGLIVQPFLWNTNLSYGYNQVIRMDDYFSGRIDDSLFITTKFKQWCSEQHERVSTSHTLHCLHEVVNHLLNTRFHLNGRTRLKHVIKKNSELIRFAKCKKNLKKKHLDKLKRPSYANVFLLILCWLWKPGMTRVMGMKWGVSVSSDIHH